MNDFYSSLEFGKVGEQLVKDFLSTSEKITCLDVTDNKDFQQQDVDFMLFRHLDGKKVGVEVKTVRGAFKSYFLETISNDRFNTRGWLEYSKADILVFVCLNENILEAHFLNLKKIKEDFEWLEMSLIEKEVVSEQHCSRGLILSFEQAEKDNYLLLKKAIRREENGCINCKSENENESNFSFV